MPLNQNAKKAIQRLQNDFGVTLDLVEDFDILLELHKVGEACENPFDPKEQERLLSLPVQCGNIKVYKPTFGALFWIEDFASDFFKEDPLIADVAVLYALAHANQPQVFDELSDKTTSKKIVKKWAKSVNVTVDQATLALENIFPNEEEKAPEKKNSIAGFIEILMNTYPGTTIEYWMWEQPIDRIDTILQQASERANNESLDKKAAPNPYAPSTIALKKMRDIISKLVKERGK